MTYVHSRFEGCLRQTPLLRWCRFWKSFMLGGGVSFAGLVPAIQFAAEVVHVRSGVPPALRCVCGEHAVEVPSESDGHGKVLVATS
jgi:hypothetical protein